jgi:hypothetical protein
VGCLPDAKPEVTEQSAPEGVTLSFNHASESGALVSSSENMEAVRAAYQASTDGDLDRFVESLTTRFLSRQSAAVPWRGQTVMSNAHE